MEIYNKNLYRSTVHWEYNSFCIKNTVANGPANRPASKKEIALCLCKIQLHMKRAVDTLVKLCDKQKIVIDFDDYQSFFMYL